MNVAIPPEFEAFARDQIAAGVVASEEEAVALALREHLAQQAERAELIAALEKGERSGISPRQVPDILAALRAEQRGGVQ